MSNETSLNRLGYTGKPRSAGAHHTIEQDEPFQTYRVRTPAPPGGG